MSSAMEIESAIRQLPESEVWKLSAWFDELRAKAWEQRLELDAKAGKLDFLFDEATRESGSLKAWPEQR